MTTSQISEKVAAWAKDFESALVNENAGELAGLLCDPSYYRDNGALTWDYRQFHGRDNVVAVLLSVSRRLKPRGFGLSDDWAAPRWVDSASGKVIEAFFDFETEHGVCVMVVHAVEDAESHSGLKVIGIFTRLEWIKGVEVQESHPRGRGYTPSFPGETWKQHRDAARRYETKEPDVIVVGAGQSGLTTAAHLRRLGVDVLNIDRYEKVGDSWGRRYEALALHNPIEMNAFPFLPFPPHYPEYLSKDLMAEWLDMFARYMDLNVWTSTEFKGARFDEATGRWSVTLATAGGAERQLHPRHVVLATGGIGGKPQRPELPGLKTFKGLVLHSSEFLGSSAYKAKKAVIVGVATSAHDIARDLCEGGVDVTMLQRGAVVVNNVETANLAYADYFNPEMSSALVDIRYGLTLINPLREIASRAYHLMAKDMDRDILDRLSKAGLQLGDGVREQGWFDLFFRTGGGYYLNTGTSEFIADGRIKVRQYDEVEEFVGNGVKLRDGTVLEADLIVLATGYQSRRAEVADAFGDDVAAHIDEVARLDSEGEWASMWGQTGQRGLWFNGGGINQMRPGSQRLALLIKADLEGLITPDFRRPPKDSGAKAGFESTLEGVA